MTTTTTWLFHLHIKMSSLPSFDLFGKFRTNFKIKNIFQKSFTA